MRDKNKSLFVVTGLAIIVIAVFLQVRKFEFVNFDDDKYVSQNEHIFSGFTRNNVRWLFTEDIGRWHPLTGLTHMLDCRLYGLNSGRHHLTNLLLHIANTLLLFIILRQMTGVFWRSAFVAALFAIHPLHVESVAWVSGRKDVLSTLFGILTIGAYFSYVKNHSAWWYTLALLLFVLGLMAKPALVTLPFVLLLFDYWPLNRLQTDQTGRIMWRKCGRLVWEKVPFLVVVGVSSMVTFFLFSSSGLVKSIEVLPLGFRLGNALISYVKYMGKMIWPASLAANYSYTENIVPYWQVLAAAVLLLVLTILAVLLGKKYKYLPVGWFFYLGTLVPVMGLIQINALAMADRYTYWSLTGLFIIIVWGFNDLLGEWRYKKIVLGVSSLTVISVLGLCAWFQTSYWRNSISLFEHAVKVTKKNYLAYGFLGAAYCEKEKLDHAVYNYNKAIEIYPKYADVYNNRGIAYFKKGEYDVAFCDYNKAIEINPVYAEAYNNRGNAYKVKGVIDRAISDYNKAIEINPRYAIAYNNRGVTWYDKGEYDLAVADCSKAVEINPMYVEAYNNRGNAYKAKAAMDDAISDYNKALAINPGYAKAYFNKAGAYEAAGRKTEAVETYKAFIRCASAQYGPQIIFAKQKIKELGL